MKKYVVFYRDKSYEYIEIMIKNEKFVLVLLRL